MAKFRELSLSGVILGGLLGANAALAATNEPITSLTPKPKGAGEEWAAVKFDDMGQLIIGSEPVSGLIEQLSPGTEYYNPEQLVANNGCENGSCQGSDNDNCRNNICFS